jgi:hypothetical protein
MTTFTFDTLEYTNRLIKAGFTREQAEETIKVMRDIQFELATKSDIANLAKDIAKDMLAMEHRLTLKLGSMLIAAIAAVGAIQKFLGGAS